MSTKNAPKNATAKKSEGSGRFKNVSARLHIIGDQRIAPGAISEPFEGDILERVRKAPCVVGGKGHRPELVELRSGDTHGPGMPEPRAPNLSKDGVKLEDALAVVASLDDSNLLIQMAETEERPEVLAAIQARLESLQG